MGSRDDSPPVVSVPGPQPSENSADLAVRPVCRVKRFTNRLYRSSPIAPSTPTESMASNPAIPSVVPPLCGRWDEGRLSASYRPQAPGALRVGGLQPPSSGPSAPHLGSLTVGGLCSFSLGRWVFFDLVCSRHCQLVCFPRCRGVPRFIRR